MSICAARSRFFRLRFGANDSDTIDANHILATVLPEVGDYAHAETLYRQVLKAYQTAYGEDDQRVGLVLMQLGTLYISWNDFGNAETCLRRALAIDRKALGDANSDTAGILGILSLVDARLGKLQQAEEECKTALSITEQTLGNDHSQTTAATLALGNLYLLEEKYDDAQKVLEDLLNKQSNGTDDQQYHNAIIREKLAAVALAKQRYEAAIEYADAATQVYDRLLPELHPHRLEALKISAIANLALKRYSRAREPIELAQAIARQQIDTASLAQSERQQLALNFRLREILDLQLSLPAEYVDAGQAYRHVLQWKGAVEARQIRQRRQVRPDDAPLVAELQATVNRFAGLSLNVPDGSERKEWLRKLDELKHHKEELEAKLAKRGDLKDSQTERGITPERLQALLPPNTALVDVLKYVRFSGGHDAQTPDETNYVAFVLTKQQAVRRIELGPAQPIDELVESCRAECLFDADDKSLGRLRKLRQLIWDPIAPRVQDCQTILYSPDASLARFPLAALPSDHPGRFLIEDYSIVLAPAPRMLAEMFARQPEPASQASGQGGGFIVGGKY